MNDQYEQYRPNLPPDGAAISIQSLKVIGVGILAIGSIIVFISEFLQLQSMEEDEGYF